MYKIEIDKNYFSDSVHTLPATTELHDEYAFTQACQSYRDSLQEMGEGFIVDEKEIENGVHFVLRPVALPKHFCAYTLSFKLRSDEHLKEFWHYFSDEKQQRYNSQGFQDLVGVVYGLLSFALTHKASEAFVDFRETKHAHVATIKGIASFEPDSIETLLHGKRTLKYFNKDNVFALFCSKDEGDKEDIPETFCSRQEDAEDDIACRFPAQDSENHARLTFVSDVDKNQLHLYDFLDYYEVDELIELLSDLKSMVLVLASSKFSSDEIDMLIHYMRSISKILNTSHESFALGMNIVFLIDGIDNNRETFLENSKDMAQMFGAFSFDLSLWVKKLFFEGAPSLNFLDDSIISNCQTIIALLSEEEGDTDNVDDIFDF